MSLFSALGIHRPVLFKKMGALFRQATSLTRKRSEAEKATETILRFFHKQTGGHDLTRKDTLALDSAVMFFMNDKTQSPSPALAEETHAYLHQGGEVCFPDLIRLYARSVPKDEASQKAFFRDALGLLATQEEHRIEHEALRAASQETPQGLRFHTRFAIPFLTTDEDPLVPSISLSANAEALAIIAEEQGPAFARWALNEIVKAMPEALAQKNKALTPLIVPLFQASRPFLQSEACSPQERQSLVDQTLATMKAFSEETNGEAQLYHPKHPLSPTIVNLGAEILRMTKDRADETETAIAGLLGLLDPMTLAMIMPKAERSVCAQELWAESSMRLLAPLCARLPNGEVLVGETLLPSDKLPAFVYSQNGGTRFRVADLSTNEAATIPAESFVKPRWYGDTPDGQARRAALVDKAKEAYARAETLDPALPKILPILERPMNALSNRTLLLLQVQAMS